MNSRRDVNRRDFLKQASLALSGLLISGCQQPATSSPLQVSKGTGSPNILFIITDHHAYYNHFDVSSGKFGMPYTETLVRIEASECLYPDMRKGAYEKCDDYAS